MRNIPEMDHAIFATADQQRAVGADTERTKPALVAWLGLQVGSTLRVPPTDHARHATAEKTFAIPAPRDVRDHTWVVY